MRLEAYLLGPTIVGAAVLGLIASACGTGAPLRPNVLVISVDSLRRDRVSAYGYRPRFAPAESTTPAVDRLAREGVLFQDAFATTSWTLPSHMALFTGLEDGLHGVTDNTKVLDPAIETMAQSFRARGYQTAGFYSGPNLHPAFGFGAGFDVYENASGVPLDDEAFALASKQQDALLAVHNRSHSGLTSPEVNRRGLDWLGNAAEADEPFFLFLHYWDPHYNYDPPAEYEARFDPDYNGTASGSKFIYSRDIKSPRDMQHILSLYDAEIRYTDDHITSVLDRLDELNLADDTLVVFVSDHGEEFYDHGKKGHQRNFFDESVRIPVVMRWPKGLPAGTVVEEQVRMQDLFPTLAELADVGLPGYVTGTSLVALTRGGKAAPPAQLFELSLPRRGTRLSGLRQRGLYVVWDHTKQVGTFFNMRLDPRQLRPRKFDDLEGSKLPAARLLRERLAWLESQRSNLPSTQGHADLDQLPAGLEADLSAQGYLGDGSAPDQERSE